MIASYFAIQLVITVSLLNPSISGRVLILFSIWCLKISLQSWKLNPPPTQTPVTLSDFRNISAKFVTAIWKASSLGIWVSPLRKLWKKITYDSFLFQFVNTIGLIENATINCYGGRVILILWFSSGCSRWNLVKSMSRIKKRKAEGDR